MRMVMLYHLESDHNRAVQEFVHDIKQIKNTDVELLSLETRDGADMARLYDIVHYPALLAVSDNGDLIKNWEGLPLPLMDEAASYVIVTSSTPK